MEQGSLLGSYRLISELGSGGMGTVHLAEVAENVAGLDIGERVAVKIVHPHLLGSPGFFKRFLREGEVGRQVRHENVIRTYDVDATEHQGSAVHYMVMEYVEGRSLRDFLRDYRTIPESLLREIARQVAAGLDAIHQAGIVHRDLKPENILITDDHRVRIMDLGVAKLQEASIAITEEGGFAGSLLYAAPEQFLGTEVGPGADLYSLGVVLYELATGDNPFRRDDMAGVIEAHVDLRPPRVADRVTEVTGFFSECVATLLAKDPGDRFPSAAAFHSVLRDAEGSRWWTEHSAHLRQKAEGMPRIPVRRDTGLHGRGDELKLLEEAWERAKRGSGNVLFFEGEAGIGKTRLLDAFARGLEGEELHLLYGSYPPSGGLGAVSEAILKKFGEGGLAKALEPYLSLTPSLVPAFAALVQNESPPTGSESLQADTYVTLCVHLMRALAGERPLVWLVEDIHFATTESRKRALALARAVEGHPVLLVVTARPGVPDDELAHFSRLENFQRAVLGRLGAREVLELLEEAFQSEALAETLGGKIAKKSDGVPFFIFEMIRGLREGRLIERTPSGDYVQTQVIGDIEVPEAVKDLIEGRLRGLTEAQRALLDVGAVQGMSFDPGLVASVLEERRIRVLRDLAEIERRFGLVRDQGDIVRFDQNQIQEVLYGDLTPHLRSEYHSVLAAAYSTRLEGEPEGEDAVFLATHKLRGSSPEEGVAHLDRALDHLEHSFRSDGLIDLANRALEHPQLLRGRRRIGVLWRKAAAHDLRGERQLQGSAVEEALRIADGIGDLELGARARDRLGAYYLEIAELDAAKERLEQALDLAREAGIRPLETDVLRHLGGVHWSLGRYEEARSLHESGLALAREIGNRRAEARATGALGNVYWILGRYEEARDHYERDLALCREIGNRRGECMATGHVGLALAGCGRYEEARVYYERHIALCREIGYRRGEAIGTGNLGNVYTNRGDYTEARALYEKHLELSRETGYRRGEALASGNLGNTLLNLGRLEEARGSFERSLLVTREIGDRNAEAAAQGHLGDLYLHLGSRAEARAAFEAELTLAEEIGGRDKEGNAQRRLGLLAEQEERWDDAESLHEESLVIYREIGNAVDTADALASLAQIEARRGETESARARLEEALSLAQESETPRVLLEVAVERARLPDGEVKDALAALAEHEARQAHGPRMAVRFRLWELAGDEDHLRVAHNLLRYLRDHAPEAYRTSMIENVPLHREILTAWKERGKRGG